ncbi:uncharacterized protein MYCGRDRAFT_106633 [Zymoseptoria tritici IPO323]|uniref:Uncharacterized protein n=1 Tax=Zymoseptoria tritici (strain CBS 115943 / IPO323) TaxID=336722 RepID=F9XRA1_ZYMTI|nr:uncharacterized protein MYCGRDRAFT_106633 [Zymoseptoria tritici IPO323]EGP82245.1 hypothetical protein MYCGRDRAFT_106633 [Zymoseptoria tritici IPO323]
MMVCRYKLVHGSLPDASAPTWMKMDIMVGLTEIPRLEATKEALPMRLHYSGGSIFEPNDHIIIMRRASSRQDARLSYRERRCLAACDSLGPAVSDFQLHLERHARLAPSADCADGILDSGGTNEYCQARLEAPATKFEID